MRKLTILLLIGILICTNFYIVTRDNNKAQTTLSAGIYDLQDKFIAIAQQATPAVVGITVTSIITQRYVMDPYRDDLFRFFFGLPERQFRQSGIGSGFIVDPNGYILTNEHVINKADDITVLLPNGEKYKAHVTGYDTRSDLAILKIDASDLPYIEMGNSDAVKPGQWAIAIGNPFAIFENSPTPSMTVGIVSAIHRSLASSDTRHRYYGDLIQTDAAINPGNSGGPLLDVNGKVIGINVAIMSRSGENAGIGFALPVNRAKTILNKLIAGEHIQYGWLGVAIQPLSNDLLRNFGLKRKQGILVAEVLPGAPAQKAGIQRRDIITKYDGILIKTVDDLIQLINNTPVGESVEIELIRNGKKKTVTAIIGDREQPQSASEPEYIETPVSWRGMVMQNITDDLALRYNLEDVDGVVVVGVEHPSPASFCGIQEGDIIDEINRHPVASLDDVKKVTHDIKGDILLHSFNEGYVIIRDYKK